MVEEPGGRAGVDIRAGEGCDGGGSAAAAFLARSSAQLRACFSVLFASSAFSLRILKSLSVKDSGPRNNSCSFSSADFSSQDFPANDSPALSNELKLLNANFCCLIFFFSLFLDAFMD